VTLATDILALDQDGFSAAFRKSPMKRAKLTGLRRNAGVVLDNIGASDTVSLLETAQEQSEP
jgi:epoxyqueuosine reductase